MSTLATTALKNPSAASNNVSLETDGSTTLTTAKMTTLADSAGANTSTPAQIASGRAKAWVNFNGTGTVAIRASYNVSSITDNGVGDYTVNFTTAMVDANYTANVGSGNNAGGGLGAWTTPFSVATATATSFRIGGYSSAGGYQDQDQVMCSIFR